MEKDRDVIDGPHYEVPAAELAAWLDRQPDTWWSVDADPVLNGFVSMPCSGATLAAGLRRVNRPLLVEDPREPPAGRGEVIGADALDGLATLWHEDRVFVLTWKDRNRDWLLIEDRDTAEAERADAAAAEGG